MRIHGFVLLATIALAPQGASGITVNVDIGDTALYSGLGAAPDSGTVWNEYAQLGGVLGGLVDSNGNATGIGFELEVTPGSFFGPPLGPSDLADTILLFASTPGLDELYDFEFSGLLPNTRYDVYGSIVHSLDPAYQSGDTPAPPQPGPLAVTTFAGISDSSGALRGRFFRSFTLIFAPAQAVQIQQVPEPGALALLLVAGSYVFRVRRARLAPTAGRR